MEREYDIISELFKGVRGLQISDIEWLSVYSDLVRGRLEDLISTSYPVFKSFLTREEFEEIMTEFIKEDHPHPLLIDLTREFVQFFISRDFSAKRRLPFLEELVKYEWTEIELFNEKDEPITNSKDWSWEEPLSLSASSRLVNYTYPVHEAYSLQEQEILNLRGNYNLLIYRDARNYEVRTVALTDFVFSFLQKVTCGEPPPKALKASPEDVDPDSVRVYLENFLRELLKVGALR